MKIENIQIGSRVTFKDGSYTLTLKQGSKTLKHESEGMRKETCTVVAVNVPFPTSYDKSLKEVLQHHNNCLVLAPNGDLIFCSAINIQLI